VQHSLAYMRDVLFLVSVAASRFKNNFETKDVGGSTDINLQSEAEDVTCDTMTLLKTTTKQEDLNYYSINVDVVDYGFYGYVGK